MPDKLIVSAESFQKHEQWRRQGVCAPELSIVRYSRAGEMCPK